MCTCLMILKLIAPCLLMESHFVLCEVGTDYLYIYILYRIQSLKGRAMDQALSPRPLTAQTLVQSRAILS